MARRILKVKKNEIAQFHVSFNPSPSSSPPQETHVKSNCFLFYFVSLCSYFQGPQIRRIDVVTVDVTENSKRKILTQILRIDVVTVVVSENSKRTILAQIRSLTKDSRSLNGCIILALVKYAT
ncbi:hypothetical protein HAX54_046627 [Datura stramonium]|uniref:Uncharacterized protein n=1 Tax=Datura stramonium TaxID=4076 RepID=A0ABS8WHD1_DATST|nr:hypothetical protein [Datura stramonium]